MEGTAEINENIEDSADAEAEAPHFKRIKDIEQPQLQSGSCKVVESPAPVMTLESDWREHLALQSPELLMEAMVGRPLSLPGSQSGCERSVGDPGVRVEEIILTNHLISSQSVGGCSSGGEESLRKKMWPNLRGISGKPKDGGSKESENVVSSLTLQGWVRNPRPDTCLGANHDKASDGLTESGNLNVVSSKPGISPSSIRPKVLPASGFSQFLIKNAVTSEKGKGIACKRKGVEGGSGISSRLQHNERDINIADEGSEPLNKLSSKGDEPSLVGGGVSGVADLHGDGIGLRKWLKTKHHNFTKVERMNLFKQIVEIVDASHSKGLILLQLRPSFLTVLPSNKVKYVGSFCPQGQVEQRHSLSNECSYLDHHSKRKRHLEVEGSDQGSWTKHQKTSMQKHGGTTQYASTRSGMRDVIEEAHLSIDKEVSSGAYFGDRTSQNDLNRLQSFSGTASFNQVHQQVVPEVLKLEEAWYSSPEDINDNTFTSSSNVYSLGVLLFEIFSSFDSWEVQVAIMSDLRHRVLPPHFLSENPKEAGFCLWLLHPDPSSRPKSRDILLYDIIPEGTDLASLDSSTARLEEADAEADLLLHFLLPLKEDKEERATKLLAEIGWLMRDIEEVGRRNPSCSTLNASATDYQNDASSAYPTEGTVAVGALPISMENQNERLMRNINQLEDAYFSLRSNISQSEISVTSRTDNDLLQIRNRWSQTQTEHEETSSDRLGVFFEGLCKFARYSKFEVLGCLRNTDILNSANVIFSLSFDRDEDYFAAAGMSKKIKIFEFSALLNDGVDIHYPVIEMSSRSRLSCTCWNSYIKNYLASSDYEGAVQLWDASTGQGFLRYSEHPKRAWSVDFSQVDPTKLASGSDDFTVKLWSINEPRSIDSVRNMANVCCVQFSPYTSHLLAFGSADCNIYCYDLRHTRIPWCTLDGHGKAVSYVKFVDHQTLVSASTDNTLKLWDLNKTTASGLSTNACNMTFSGHTNQKNFIGLSVSDGYIACGSETNEVYAYHKTFPMPITSHKFGSVDPVTGLETCNDGGQFVSSVCCKGKSNMVVAANSSGSIKVLRLV